MACVAAGLLHVDRRTQIANLIDDHLAAADLGVIVGSSPSR